MSSSALLVPSRSLDGAQGVDALLSPRGSCGLERADFGRSPSCSFVEQLKPGHAGGGRRSSIGDGLHLEADHSVDAATLAKLRGHWLLPAVGKPAAAAVLMNVQVQRIPDGGPDGVKAVAAQLIQQHQLDDTFYIMDLANVVRLFKTPACCTAEAAIAPGRAPSHPNGQTCPSCNPLRMNELPCEQ